MASDRGDGTRGNRRDWRRSPASNLADEDVRHRHSPSRRHYESRNDRSEKYSFDLDHSKGRSSQSNNPQSRRDDKRWRSGERVGTTTAGSLASRIAPARGEEGKDRAKTIRKEADRTPNLTEDDDVRQRRIQRLKRRRRSAGLESDVSDDELERWSATLEAGSDKVERKAEDPEKASESQMRPKTSSKRGSDDEGESKRRRYRSENGGDRWREERRDPTGYDDRRGEGRREAGGISRSSRADASENRGEGRDRRTRERSSERDDRHHLRHADRNEQMKGGTDVQASHSRSARSPEAVTLRRRRSRSRTPPPKAISGREKNGHSTPVARSDAKQVQEQRALRGGRIQGSSRDADLPRRAAADEVYERLAQVGEGTYGQVFKARSDKSGILVALKKIRMDAERDGFPITAMREVKLLQGLRHENIVRLHEMMLSKHSIYMVFEYLQHDLNGILAHPNVEFTPAHLKSLAAQLLSGLAYIHKHSILHRDLKCSNLLLNNEGTLKLADFGLARAYTKQDRAPRRRTLDYTNRVVTLWYRAPELLFGETSYGDAMDVWGAGCIFLELFLRKPVFQGNDEMHQVHLLFTLLGPVLAEEWPEAMGLPWFDLVKPAEPSQDFGVTDAVTIHRQHLRRLLPSVQDDVLEAALALLTYNPAVRLPAQAALDTLPYFARNEPRAEKPAKLLQGLHGEWHEFESRKARREAAAQALHAHVHRENVNEREKRKKEQTKDDEGPPHTGTLTSGQGEQNAGQVDTETGSNPIKESKDDGYVSA